MDEQGTKNLILEQKRSRFTKEVQFLLIIPFVILFFQIVLKNAFLSALFIPLYLLLFFTRTNMNEFITKNENIITVERLFSRTRVSEESIIEISLIITNKSMSDTQLVELIDSIPPSFELVEGTNIFVFDLKMNEILTLQYSVSAKEIGIYEFGSVFLRHTDYFGTFIHSYYYAFEETPKIFVIPKFERLDNLQVYTNYLRYFNGYFVSKHYGTDSDFRGVREYQNGDKLRQINWKIC